MVSDSLAMGCLLANVSGWLETKSRYPQLFRPAGSIGLPAFVLLVNRSMGCTVDAVFGSPVVRPR